MSRAHLDPVVPSAQDALLAKEAQRALEKSEAPEGLLQVQISVAGRESTTLDLPPVVMELLVDILKETAAGKAVSLVSVEREITTQQAAALLNVSRPYLVGLIEKGELPARMVGNQRRLPLQDVLAYKAANRAKRRSALQEMAAADQELGLI
jgi:excisionase family DNA binding protein